jgi:hypothetical protein
MTGLAFGSGVEIANTNVSGIQNSGTYPRV